jgi:hypothetical protein
MTSETISVLANVALALSFIVGLVFGIAQVSAAARDRRERLTLETLRNFQTREFAELMQYLALRDVPQHYDGWKALPPAEQVLIMQFAQQMESLGILVAQRLVNLDLVEKTLGSFVSTSWAKIRPVFLEMREKAPDPFLGEYFQWLAERIDERMANKPRIPAYKNLKG